MKALLFVLTLLCIPLPASATLIFDWTGTCVTTCTGQATFHVETADTYVPGTDSWPAAHQLLVARYTDNLVTFDLARDFATRGESFNIPAIPVGAFGGVGLFGDSVRSDDMGRWAYESESVFLPGCVRNPNPCNYDARGIDGVWTDPPGPTAVPWPPSALLMAVAVLTVAVGATAIGRARPRL